MNLKETFANFTEVSVDHKTLKKKYDDLYFWKDSHILTGNDAIEVIETMMKDNSSLFVSSIDEYTLMPQIYYEDDLDFLKRVIKKNKVDYLINVPDRIYLQYRLVVYKDKIIDGCLYKRDGVSLLSKLYNDDLEYLNIIFKEKILAKWKPDYPLYIADLFYVEGMKGYKISDIKDIRNVDLFKIDIQKINDIITGKIVETKGKKKK